MNKTPNNSQKNLNYVELKNLSMFLFAFQKQTDASNGFTELILDIVNKKYNNRMNFMKMSVSNISNNFKEIFFLGNLKSRKSFKTV